MNPGPARSGGSKQKGTATAGLHIHGTDVRVFKRNLLVATIEGLPAGATELLGLGCRQEEIAHRDGELALE